MAKPSATKQQPFKDTISIICGGSKGIGKATVKEIARLGGSLCIIARGAEVLHQVAQEAASLKTSEGQFVETITCDTTDMQALKPLLTDFIDRHGVPDFLINLVGYAYPQYIQHLTLEDFEHNMHVNYYGQLVPILILLPHFMQARKGHIANVSSGAGFLGAMGYATYAPSKYAIAGLTEVLRHELKPYNITTTVLYPPDTDTPGFEIENQTKPQEWFITEVSQLHTPEVVARDFVAGILKKKTEILPGQIKFYWVMFRHFPNLVRFFIDREYRQAREKLGKS